MAYTTINKLYQSLREILKLKWLNPGVNLNRHVKTGELHRPGLALAGYYGYFTFDRVQILGKTEMTFLMKLPPAKRVHHLKKLFSYRIPCLVVTKNQIVPDDLLQAATHAKIPVFKTSLATSTVASRITVFIEEDQAAETSVHATLVDVFGTGTLLIGKSGAGKSECALELIERGHRLVADDIVKIRLTAGNYLMGFSNQVIKHYMEIRGIGLVDIKGIFGVGAVRNAKRIGLVVTLEPWKEGGHYERLGLDEVKYTILGIPLPHLILPVKPGRNLPVIVEVAVLNQRAKRMGMNPSKLFNQELMRTMGVVSSQKDFSD
jgi:HPr kinase/phosphorylase